MTTYITPNVYNQLVDYPPTHSESEIKQLEKLGIKYWNWHGYTLAIGPGLWLDFFEEIMQRIHENKSVIIAITGPPGEGKTWFGLRLCEIFVWATLKKKIDPEKQICFDRASVARIMAEEVHLEPGQWILIDEAHMATGARHWNEEAQKELVDQLAAIRSRGICVIVVALHISMLDKILREFALTYHIFINGRGVGTPYAISLSRFDSRSFAIEKGRVYLSIPNYEECPSPNCLRCRFLPTCNNWRAQYERMKRTYLKSAGEESLKKLEEKQRRKIDQQTIDRYVEIVYKYHELVKRTQRGGLDPISIQEILKEKEGVIVKPYHATILSKLVATRHPDVKWKK